MVKPTIVIFTPTPKMNKVPQKTPSFVIYHHVSELLTFSFQGYPPWLFHHLFFCPGFSEGLPAPDPPMPGESSKSETKMDGLCVEGHALF
jgi:hypothetical protein